MPKKLDPGKAPGRKSNRVDPEIQIPIAHVAMDHLIKEIDLLEALYDAADFTKVITEVPEPEDGVEEESTAIDWLTKGKFFRSVAERNRAIQSQYNHIREAARAASGCIHPTRSNTESERKASVEVVQELTKRVKDKAANWEKNKAKLRSKVDESETLDKEDENTSQSNLLEL